MGVLLRRVKGECMTKVSNTNHDVEMFDEEDMLDEYDFSNGARGKYLNRYPKNYQTSLQGIQFLTNNEGRKTAVLIYLKEHSKVWADVVEKYGNMASFQFLTDEQGEKTAVLLNFKEHLEIWEYIYDRLIANLIS